MVDAAYMSVEDLITLSTEIVEVRMDRVRPSKLMLRSADENYVKEIAVSMSEMGQLEPILVRPLPDDYVEVVDGHHRVEAAKQLGWSSIKCRIVSMDDVKAFQTAEITHLLRNHNIDPIAESNGFVLMRNEGMTEEQIGKSIGKSQQYVSARIILQNLEPHIRALVTSRLVKAEHAYEIARIDDSRKRKLLATMARTDRSRPLTLIEVRELAKASWEELYKNEQAKQILKEDPDECGRIALIRLEETDNLVQELTHGSWESLLRWLAEMQRWSSLCLKVALAVAIMRGHGFRKRDRCACYIGDICTRLDSNETLKLISKEVEGKLRFNVREYPEFCATCPDFQEKTDS